MTKHAAICIAATALYLGTFASIMCSLDAPSVGKTVVGVLCWGGTIAACWYAEKTRTS
ncbi:MAG: hypothetical protein K2W82_10760 [Candidatus Obscuribacterales bacterium]|nr:hypothetical protein [Candidatus Obscuribacterales bacterium]